MSDHPGPLWQESWLYWFSQNSILHLIFSPRNFPSLSSTQFLGSKFPLASAVFGVESDLYPPMKDSIAMIPTLTAMTILE